MSGLLTAIVLVVALTHALRAVGTALGPRWSGLILGLPTTTAIALFVCEREKGVTGALEMADMSILGLAGAVSLSLAFGYVVQRGWKTFAALGMALVGYGLVATVLSSLAPRGLLPRFGLVLVMIGSACVLSARYLTLQARPRGAVHSRSRTVLLRSLVPIICITLVYFARVLVGARWAGLVSTFPGLSLTMMIVSLMEMGPAEAVRIARALPPGNVCTFVFLTCFRASCNQLGLAGAFGGSYAVAFATLPFVAWLDRRGERAVLEEARPRAAWPWNWRRHELSRAQPHRPRRAKIVAFSPIIETIV